MFRQITLAGLVAGVGLIAARGADKPLASHIRAAFLSFQDQKATSLAEQKYCQKSCAKKARDEVRDLLTCSKSVGITPLRQEVRESIEDAKRRAIEQGRKLGQETAEIARDTRRNSL